MEAEKAKEEDQKGKVKIASRRSFANFRHKDDLIMKRKRLKPRRINMAGKSSFFSKIRDG